MIYISFDIGVKNLAICIIEYTDVMKIIDWRIISLAETKKELKGIDDISERIFAEMDNVIGGLKEMSVDFIDYVLIENQPSNLNGIMKTIQHIIYCYFSLVKYWDKTVGNVVLVNASLKCKNHEYKPDIPALSSEAQKNSKGFKREKYKQNKAMSIAICRHYIQNDEKLLEIFDTNKKKDDLCDSCLQAVSYIRSKAKDLSSLFYVTSK
jgi:hypothetical protein